MIFQLLESSLDCNFGWEGGGAWIENLMRLLYTLTKVGTLHHVTQLKYHNEPPTRTIVNSCKNYVLFVLTIKLLWHYFLNIEQRKKETKKLKSQSDS